MKWKTIAIIFIILFISENLLIGFFYYLEVKEIEETNNCYYNICEEYPEAEYLDDICFCYDYDVLGDYVIVKTEYNP